MTPPGRVVVGVDDSPGSVRALRWAARQAFSSGAELTAVTAWEPRVSLVASPAAVGMSAAGIGDGAPEVERSLVHAARLVGSQAVHEAGLAAWPVTLEQRRGAPGPVLAAAALGAGMLVLGPPRHGPVMGALRGSVAVHLLMHAPCPLIVVREAT